MTVAFLLVASVALDLAGIGGWRGGLLWVGVPLVGGSIGLATWSLRATPSRTTWTLVAAVAGLILTGVVAPRATASPGALSERMSKLSLPYFERTAETRRGHSWCRPTCSVVDRTYKAPNTSVRALAITVAGAMYGQHLFSDAHRIAQLGKDRYLLVRARRLTAEAFITRTETGFTVRIRYSAH